jgi:hypothetical protein
VCHWAGAECDLQKVKAPSGGHWIRDDELPFFGKRLTLTLTFFGSAGRELFHDLINQRRITTIWNYLIAFWVLAVTVIEEVCSTNSLRCELPISQVYADPFNHYPIAEKQSRPAGSGFRSFRVLEIKLSQIEGFRPFLLRGGERTIGSSVGGVSGPDEAPPSIPILQDREEAEEGEGRFA